MNGKVSSIVHSGILDPRKIRVTKSYLTRANRLPAMIRKSMKRGNVMKLHLIKLRKFLILANGQKNPVELISMLVIYLRESAIGVTKLREIECRRPSERELKWFSKLEPINLKENISQVKTHLLRERKFNLIKIEVLLCMSLRI